MNIDKEKLFQQFKDIKNIMNIDIILCFKELFCIKGIIKNINFYIIIPFIIFHLIVIIIFYCKQKKKLYEKIKKINFCINNWYLIEEEEKEKRKKQKKQKKRGTNELKSRDKKKNESLLKLKSRTMIDKGENINKIKDNKKKNKKHNFLFNNGINNNINNLINETNSNNKIINIIKTESNNVQNKSKIIKKLKKIMNPNLEETNKMSYKLALKNDKRSFLQYYASLIKTKHNIVFSFVYNEDYNSKIIKIDIFFTNFVVFFAINALFFNDNTMHKIYTDQGTFNFIYQIPQIIYSFLISSVIDILITSFSLSEDDILDFKKDKNKTTVKQRYKNLKKKLQIKFIFYFIISFLLLLFFWYYLAMFGVVYKNTQIHLIKDTVISYILSFISPFGFYLIPAIFRICSLSKKKKKCFYKLSLFFQSI